MRRFFLLTSMVFGIAPSNLVIAEPGSVISKERIEENKNDDDSSEDEEESRSSLGQVEEIPSESEEVNEILSTDDLNFTGKPTSSQLLRKLLSAQAAILTTIGITYPLDLLKTERQGFKAPFNVYKISHLYRGVILYSSAMMLSTGLSFAVYGVLTSYYGWKPELAGAASGLVGSFASNPIWIYRIIKITKKAEGKEYGFRDFAKDFSKNLRLGYRGLALNSVYSSSELALHFSMMERFRKKLYALDRKDEVPQIIKDGGAGAFGRTISTTVMYPLDIIRSISSRETKQSYWATIKNTYKKEGLTAFYKGVGYGAARSWLGAALLAGSLSYFNKILCNDSVGKSDYCL